MTTQEVKPVTRGAQELRKLLQEQGRVPIPELREWLAEQDPELTPSTINLALGYGMTQSRTWWYEDGEGFLVNGPKPGTKAALSAEETPGTISDEVKKVVTIDPSTMSEPRDQFYTIAMNLGIPEKAAKACAVNCFGTHDPFNPEEAWKGIVQSAELTPSQKKRLWENWCSWAGLKVPQALAEKVEKQYTPGASADAAKPGTPISGRRFIAVKGEVMQVDSDEPSGMSFTEALRVADQQLQKAKDTSAAPAAATESPTVAAMITVLGNLATAALTPRPDPGTANSTTEIVKLMVDSARSDSANSLALIKQEMDHRLENEARDRKAAEERSNAILLKLTDLIERQGQPKNPFDSLDQVLPGIGAKLLDKLLNPPSPEGGFMVSLTGADGEPGKVSLDDYERFSKIQDKREIVHLVRQHLPQLVQVGRDLALATERAVNRGREEQPSGHQLVSRKDMGYDGFCVACLRVLKLPDNVTEFTCPYPDCGALQSLAGEIIEAIKPASRAEPDTEGEAETREEASAEVAPSTPEGPTAEQELASGVANG